MPDQEKSPGLNPYQVIVDKNLKKLVERVNEEIKRGYVPVGGIALDKNQSPSSDYYLQALVLRAFSG